MQPPLASLTNSSRPRLVRSFTSRHCAAVRQMRVRRVSEPVALYAPKVAGQEEAPVEREPVGARGDGAGDGEGLAEALRRRLARPVRR